MSGTPTDTLSLAVDARSILFLFTAAGVAINIIFLDRVSEDRVRTIPAVKPMVMWIFCCFRVYFTTIIIISTLCAFIIALAAIVAEFSTVSAAYWIIGLLLLSLGTLKAHKHTIEEAVEWEIISSK